MLEGKMFPSSGQRHGIHRHGIHRRHGGFTLVEMLVVIGIITILAAILIPAVYMGLAAADNFAITAEVANLDAQMRQYKTVAHGYAYPPNFGSDPAVRAHIAQKYGRVNWAAAGAVVPPTGLDPAETLVFWLQGYGPDPTNPLAGARKELYDFDEARLVPTRTVGAFQLYHYYPRGGQKVPYVYFHSGSYGSASYTATSPAPGTGTVRPYKKTGGAEFVNADSYQIISAGQDGDWGTDNANKQFPSGANYSVGDQDNIANFSEGKMGDQIP